eukprot:g9897.t1
MSTSPLGLSEASAPTPGVLVRVGTAGEMQGRYGIAFEQAEDMFRVRMCTRSEEPLKLVRAPAAELEAIELCVLLCANVSDEKGMERFEVQTRAVVKFAVEPLSFDSHLRQLLPHVPENAYVCFQDQNSLSCSTRFAAHLHMIQNMPPETPLSVLDVRANWWPGVEKRERPRNGEEVDQLFECQAAAISPALGGKDECQRLYPYLFHAGRCFSSNGKDFVGSGEDGAQAPEDASDDLGAGEARVLKKIQADIREPWVYRPIDFNNLVMDDGEPLDWGYFPDALL